MSSREPKDLPALKLYSSKDFASRAKDEPRTGANGAVPPAFAVYDESFLLGEFGGDWGFVFGGESPERRDPSVVQKADSFRMTCRFINQVPAYQKPSQFHGL